MTSMKHWNTFDIPTSEFPTNQPKTEVFYQVTPTCSCSQCNSIDCFKIRYKKGNLLCTCPDCKVISLQKNDSSKKLNTYEEVTKELKENENCRVLQNVSISKSELENKEFYDPCNREATKEVVLDLQRDLINAQSNIDLEKVISDEASYLKIIAKVEDDLQKENQNIQIQSKLPNIKHNDRSYNETTRKDLKKIEEDNLPNIKIENNLIKQKCGNKNCYHNTRKTVRDDEQTHLLKTCIKCGHLNKTNDAKACCDLNKTSAKIHDHKITKIKSDSSHIKSDYIKCCEESKNSIKRNDQINILKSDDISYREITRKTIKEHIIQKDTFNNPIKSDKSEFDLCEHTQLNYKNTTLIKDGVREKDRSYEEYTRNYSVAMTYTRNEEKTIIEDPAATLSAQIMDLPYKDYKDSFTSHKPIDIRNSDNIYNITKQDILARLKEIYKACSCKICECIPGFSTDKSKGSTCGCLNSKHTYSKDLRHENNVNNLEPIQLPHSGCACYRCDRKDCRGVWKNKMKTVTCDCKPCECVKYSKSFTKPCDCEPCQCAECTALNFYVTRPVIVAPVQGNFQQNLCQCEPCECVHCTHNYGTMASSLMREASTGMASHRNCNCVTCANNSCQSDGADCRCDSNNKIIRKPIDRTIRDFDLRRALIDEHSFNQNRSDKIKNCDTIAMYAFSNNYSNIFNKPRDGCRCMECECIFCKDDEKYASSIKKSYNDIPLAFSNLSDQSLNMLKCQACKNQICCKNEDSESDKIQLNIPVECETSSCDCKNCKEIPFCTRSHNIVKDSFYPLKKGELLTPSMFEAKLLAYRQFQSQLSLPILKKPSTRASILKLNGKKPKKILCPQSIKICHLKSSKNNCGNGSKHSSKINVLFNFKESNIKTVPKQTGKIVENQSIRCDMDAQKNVNGTPTSIIYRNKYSDTCIENNINGTIYSNHRNIESNNDVKLFKNKVSGDADLFYSRIKSFEKSILQIYEDISYSRKALAEICSKNGMSYVEFSEKNAETSFCDTIFSNSQLTVHKSNINDSIEFAETEESGKKRNVEYKEMFNDREILVANKFSNVKCDQNDNLSKGDNKMYTRLIRKSHVSNLRRTVKKSRVKKLSRYSENKIMDFISDRIKENYRHFGNNLNRKYSTKSASTSHDNILTVEHKKLKFKDENEYSQTDFYPYHGDGTPWSVLRKNLLMDHTPVTQKGICTTPELQLSTKLAVQSISIQTNETRGYAALTKLRTEVSSLLNSPMLKKCLKSDLNVGFELQKNVDFIPKSKLDLEIKHKKSADASSQTHKHTSLVDKETNYEVLQLTEEINTVDVMKKLVEFLLTRTVCKSELTRPLITSAETPKMPKINSVKSSSEALKARFLGLRRVSDHTVLVRWKMPRQVEDVQGYELQVDGRPVQKILSPTRCMAVLTCLPHCEKLVLSIRTLTFSQPRPEHHPTATIVCILAEGKTTAVSTA